MESKSTSEPVSDSAVSIEGITEPAISNYFQTLNAGKFAATAALFALDGSLKPPFEADIVGPTAIAAYLEQEATGMQFLPRQGSIEELEPDQRQVEVAGKVQTSLFSVNVLWIFILNDLEQIISARIKLLASPKELLNLRQ